MNAESNASPRKYAVALIGCISGVAVAATGPATNCNVGYLQGTVSSATHLSAASIVAATATTPEYCRVDGTIHTPTSQALTFAVGLPTSWNDKFVMLTQGGFAGAVPKYLCSIKTNPRTCSRSRWGGPLGSFARM